MHDPLTAISTPRRIATAIGLLPSADVVGTASVAGTLAGQAACAS